MPIATKPPLTLATLSSADRDSFVAAVGGVFEHSPWVAEAAWSERPFASVDALHAAMARVVRAAPPERRLALIRAHPELAGKEAADGSLTADSRSEQASAGLDGCSADERKQLRELNRAYRDKFGFPFVIAVRNRSRREILQALATRLGNERETEFARCIEEIATIARLRLGALLSHG